VNAIAIQPDGKVLIAGGFSSVDNISRHGVARLNPDGSLDSTFNPGFGADGPVTTLDLQSNGKVVIGGSFGLVNNVPRNNVARLNPDGSVDASFNPGSGPDGTVWSVAVEKTSVIEGIGSANSGSGPAEFRTNIVLTATNGTVLVSYNFYFVPDSLHIYYGTNLIYNSGITNGSATIAVPFGPGVATNTPNPRAASPL